jgi:hypothetical protein
MSSSVSRNSTETARDKTEVNRYKSCSAEKSSSSNKINVHPECKPRSHALLVQTYVGRRKKDNFGRMTMDRPAKSSISR